MRPSLLPLALPLLLLLPACGSDDDPEVEVETPPEEVGQPGLLGTWTVAEVDGRTPTQEVTLQFTPQGEMIRVAGGAQQRATYTFAGDRYVEVTDATGVTRYEIEVLGDDAVVLRTGAQALRLARRGAGVDLSDVPPPPPDTARPAAPAADTADTAGTGR